MDTGHRSGVSIRWLGYFIALAGLLLFALGVWWFVAVLPWEGSIDYSKRSPEEVFQAVTGRSVPLGVSDIRVAGRSYPAGLKHWVYIRFRANDAALDELAAKDEQVTGRLAQTALQYPQPASSRYDVADRKRVDWDGLYRISRPEIYLVTGGRSPFVWAGFLILDRRNHLGYIGSNGD